MRLGFTGTREDPTDEQKLWLACRIAELKPAIARHGCCVGSDYEFHTSAGQQGYRLALHPPEKDAYLEERCFTEYADLIQRVWAPKPYLTRDDDIVNGSTYMLALAKAHTNHLTLGSGTWYTVRYAIERHVPVDVCYPSGKVVHY